MLEVKKYENCNNSLMPNQSYKISNPYTNESFEIFYLDDADLCITSDSFCKEISFEIKKDDFILHNIFSELFENLKTNKIYKEFSTSHEYLKQIDGLKPKIYDENTKTLKVFSSEPVNFKYENNDIKDHFEITEKLGSFYFKIFNKGENYPIIKISLRSEYKQLAYLFFAFYESFNKYYPYYQVSMEDYMKMKLIKGDIK